MYDIDYVHIHIYIYADWLFSKAPSWTAIAGGLVAAVPGQAQVRLTKLLSMVVFGSHKRW